MTTRGTPSSDGGPTRMIGAHHLAQKDPKCHHWGIDSIIPIHTDSYQCSLDRPLRKHTAKRKYVVLQKLLSKELELPREFQ